jgi:folate-binding protein YgfZ
VPLDVVPPFGDLERIDEGIPGAPELARDLVPHAVGATLLARCVSFTKGCYPGQELVARLQARGATPPYVLRGLRAASAVAPGDPVGDPTFTGVVTSVVADPDDPDGHSVRALCVLHRRDAAGATVEVRPGPGAVVARLC